MVIDFRLNGTEGQVAVDFERNVNPLALGSQPEARDFPVCTATVHFAGRGYSAVMGWVQFVRSSDNRSNGQQFELDPLAFLGDLPHPFCWLGINPTLFDAPSRPSRDDLDWTARSYLCIPDDEGAGLEIRPLLGFSWGFRIEGGEILLEPPQQLNEAAWDEHVSDLRIGFSGWHFPPGFRTG